MPAKTPGSPMPVNVHINPEWRERARRCAKESGFPSMRTGKLAEFAVIHYLRKQGVPLREDQTPGNRPDYFDINLGSTLVDVKSCLEPAEELRVTKDHFDRGRRFAFYIGVQISRDLEEARIFGFCSKDAVGEAGHRKVGKRECYVLPFLKLEPIQKLALAFRKD